MQQHLIQMQPMMAAYYPNNVTTDHISPAGAIPRTSAAGQYLREAGVEPRDFNQYSTRRSNFEVMVRGAFTNHAVHNRLLPPLLMTDHAAFVGIYALMRHAAARARKHGFQPVTEFGRGTDDRQLRDPGSAQNADPHAVTDLR